MPESMPNTRKNSVIRRADTADTRSVPSLKNAVKQCVETEEAVKSGRMNDMMSVEILILSVLPS